MPANSTTWQQPIHPDTGLGPVSLMVADLERMQGFYANAIGLQVVNHSGDVVRLGCGDTALIELIGDPDARVRPRGTTGLFHVAVLTPDRTELARAIRRVLGTGWSFSGASDHLVSEAMYLDDPEGNGIEIYRDRPRNEWRYVDGQVAMATLPLDIDGVLAELGDKDAPSQLSPATRIGHVHLQVADLAAAEAFYSGILGFEVTVRGYSGALFVSAGGYHHHIGLNTWASRAAAAPPPGARGLSLFEIVLPNAQERDRLKRRLHDAGAAVEAVENNVVTQDPFANRIRLSAPVSS